MPTQWVVYLRLYLTGFVMGLADLVPGVSGGTVAFISGIYEELLQSIKTVSGETLRLALRLRLREAIGSIPFRFLVPLVFGLFTAVLGLANLLSWLLRNHPVFVWAFFFGLVLASVFIVLKRVARWDLADIAGFALSTVAAFLIVGSVPVQTPNNLPMMFLSGMIAICAMILPGISGSFILVILGKYEQLLQAVTQRDVVTLVVFMVGAALGLSLFSRVLTWLFATHHDLSIAILAGFMLGSLRKIWPWKEVVLTRVNSHGEVVPVVENNVLPPAFDVSVLATVVLFAIAIVLMIALDRMHTMRQVAAAAKLAQSQG